MHTIETEHTVVLEGAIAELQATLREALAKADRSTRAGQLDAASIRAQLAIAPAVVRWMAVERENGENDATIYCGGLQALLASLGTVISSSVPPDLRIEASMEAVKAAASYLPRAVSGGCPSVVREYSPQKGRA